MLVRRCFLTLLPFAVACTNSATYGGPSSLIDEAKTPEPVDANAMGANNTDPLTVVLPGGEMGIGFDDLRYSAALHRVLVPGGRAGVIEIGRASCRERV